MLVRCHPLRALAANRTSAPSTSSAATAVRPPSRRRSQSCRAAASTNGSAGQPRPSLMMPDADAPPQAMTLDDYLGPRDGGTNAAPRLMSPLPQKPSARDGTPLSQRPYLVFLPGIDGTGMNALGQFGLLAPHFELVALNIPNTDRTPFAELVDRVVSDLTLTTADFARTRPVYLLGESFGGILALAVAMRMPRIVHRVVLVNPATSYPRSPWPGLGPRLTQLPDEVYTQLLPLAVSPLVSNPVAMVPDGAVDQSSNPLDQLSQLGQAMLSMTPALQKLALILPKDTLLWKLQMLADGAEQVNPRLGEVTQRVLVVCGTEDRLIPSKDEAGRLARRLPRCSTTMVEGGSHAMLMESKVDLMQIIQETGFYTPHLKMTSFPKATRKAAPGLGGPMEIPTHREMTRASEGGIDVLTRLASPVFLSTRPSDGKPMLGLGGMPTGRPLLIIGNHQTFAPDLPMLISGVLEQRGVLIRGLTHPAAFMQGGPGGMEGGGDSDALSGPGGAGILSSYGAVPVSGRNMYRLMEAGEVVLLYPGGVREAYKRKGEEYQLIWPSRPEVIRMAARFNATIVPLSAIGADDAVDIALDSQDLLNLPFGLGDRIREQFGQLPTARKGSSVSDDIDESFIPPVPSPFSGPPNRFYYLFGEPMTLTKADAEDPAAVEALYEDLRHRVEGGIDYLLSKRKQDPYADFFKRTAYEALWGGSKRAPTFDP